MIPGERGQEVWNRKRIGLAVADSIEGPFIRQDQPLLEPRDCSHWDCTITTNPSVVILPDGKTDYESKFRLPEKIRTVCWLDNGANVAFCQDGQDVALQTEPYRYGRSLVVRVAKITVEE